MAAARSLAFARRFERVIRFLLVGGGVTLVYTVLALCLHEGGVIADATLASVAAYLATQPIAFLAHKHLTFPDASRQHSSWHRFGAMSLAGLAITAGSMKVISVLGMPFWFGLVIGWVCIPIANFFISAVWIFRTRTLLSINDAVSEPFSNEVDIQPWSKGADDSPLGVFPDSQ